jgi:hypothetical protein
MGKECGKDPLKTMGKLLTNMKVITEMIKSAAKGFFNGLQEISIKVNILMM